MHRTWQAFVSTPAGTTTGKIRREIKHGKLQFRKNLVKMF
jgi:hypothetical protein